MEVTLFWVFFRLRKDEGSRQIAYKALSSLPATLSNAYVRSSSKAATALEYESLPRASTTRKGNAELLVRRIQDPCFVPTADSGPSAAYSFATEQGILLAKTRLRSVY
ncbi:hypothetical protein RJT34_02684 [Clitoria ternatea]|uniref:Uncharacterized protein n=1 Tax=Clitoria ternatea TaxID=43366 RepID=A0AAN9KKS4_CLITE